MVVPPFYRLFAFALPFIVAACSGGSESAQSDTSSPDSPPGEQTANALTPEEAGKKLFNQCRICHAVAKDKNGVGPSLYGVVGAKAGHLADFSYSQALRNSGIFWTEAELSRFIEAPAKTMPGTRMSYQGMKNPQDRAALIAYLKTLK